MYDMTTNCDIVSQRKHINMTCSLCLVSVSQEDHSDADCLVIAVLTHGLGERYLWANDMPYFVEKLWLPFTADKCRTLAGKPKIFFIQVNMIFFSPFLKAHLLCERVGC